MSEANESTAVDIESEMYSVTKMDLRLAFQMWTKEARESPDTFVDPNTLTLEEVGEQSADALVNYLGEVWA